MSTPFLCQALTGQPSGLRGEVASHADVEPMLDLGGQLKDLDSHSGVLCNSEGRGRQASEPGDVIDVRSDMGSLTDRLQYLSVNIL
jgi:hypothetical protein